MHKFGGVKPSLQIDGAARCPYIQELTCPDESALGASALDD